MQDDKPEADRTVPISENYAYSKSDHVVKLFSPSVRGLGANL